MGLALVQLPGAMNAMGSLLLVTFHHPYNLTLAHPNPSPLVNEVKDPGAKSGCLHVKGSCCLEVVLHHHPRKWVVPLNGVLMAVLC